MIIKRRERDAILQSLQAGLVPKIGLHLIQVGRKQEVNAVLGDIDRIADGGAACRWKNRGCLPSHHLQDC